MLRRLAAAAAALVCLAPAGRAGAQTFAERTFALFGCDYSHPDLFGPGPRVCMRARATALDYTDAFGVQRFTELSVIGSAYAYTGYASAETVGQVLHAFTVFPTDEERQDESGFAACVQTVCRGAVSVAVIGAGRGAYGSVPSAVAHLAYFAAGVPDGTAVGSPGDPGPVAFGDVYLEVVTPEPTTLALAGAGVVLLGAWARQRAA